MSGNNFPLAVQSMYKCRFSVHFSCNHPTGSGHRQLFCCSGYQQAILANIYHWWSAAPHLQHRGSCGLHVRLQGSIDVCISQGESSSWWTSFGGKIPGPETESYHRGEGDVKREGNAFVVGVSLTKTFCGCSLVHCKSERSVLALKIGAVSMSKIQSSLGGLIWLP